MDSGVAAVGRSVRAGQLGQERPRVEVAADAGVALAGRVAVGHPGQVEAGVVVAPVDLRRHAVPDDSSGSPRRTSKEVLRAGLRHVHRVGAGRDLGSGADRGARLDPVPERCLERRGVALVAPVVLAALLARQRGRGHREGGRGQHRGETDAGGTPEAVRGGRGGGTAGGAVAPGPPGVVVARGRRARARGDGWSTGVLPRWWSDETTSVTWVPPDHAGPPRPPPPSSPVGPPSRHRHPPGGGSQRPGHGAGGPRPDGRSTGSVPRRTDGVRSRPDPRWRGVRAGVRWRPPGPRDRRPPGPRARAGRGAGRAAGSLPVPRPSAVADPPGPGQREAPTARSRTAAAPRR